MAAAIKEPSPSLGALMGKEDPAGGYAVADLYGGCFKKIDGPLLSFSYFREPQGY